MAPLEPLNDGHYCQHNGHLPLIQARTKQFPSGKYCLLSKTTCTRTHSSVAFFAVLRIRKVFIQVWIHGYVPLEYGFGFGSCSFLSDFQDTTTRLSFFCLLLTLGIFTSVFKDNKSIRSYYYNLRFFLIFLLDDGRDRIRTNNNGSGSGRSRNLRRTWNTALLIF